MTDQHTTSPETDDEIRDRLQTFARRMAEHADTEAALRRMTRRSRPHPPAVRIVAAAACLIVAIAVVASNTSDRQSIEASARPDTATRPIDGPVTLARGVVQFVEAPASEGIGIPPGGGLELPGGGGLGGSTLDLFVQERDGQVTGEGRFEDFAYFPGNPRYDVTVDFQCATSDAADLMLGGIVTTSGGSDPAAGMWIALLLRDGDPDRAVFWWDEGVTSCREILEAVPYPRPDDRLVEVADGDNIQTDRSPS